MTAFITGLRLLVRLAFLVLLILGLYIWIEGAGNLASAHMGIGFVFVILVLALAVVGAVKGGGIGLAVITAIWAIVIPIIGIAQLKLMPGNLHWVIRTIHLLVAIGVMPFVERLARKALGHLAGGAAGKAA